MLFVNNWKFVIFLLTFHLSIPCVTNVDCISNNIIPNRTDIKPTATSGADGLRVVEDDEIRNFQNIRNLDDEIKNREILDIGSNNDVYFSNNSSGCDVLKDELIEVAIDHRDILKTQEFICSITPVDIRLYFRDRYNKSDSILKKGDLFARFSINAIVTPLETLRSSRECFRMFYKSEPLVLCGDSTKSRDLWMLSILKAKFCHYSHMALSPSHKTTGSLPPKELPPFSTKLERLKARGKIAKVGFPQHDNKITNIDIKNLPSGEPRIFLNGDEITQNS